MLYSKVEQHTLNHFAELSQAFRLSTATGVFHKVLRNRYKEWDLETQFVFLQLLAQTVSRFGKDMTNENASDMLKTFEFVNDERWSIAEMLKNVPEEVALLFVKQ